MEKLLEHKLHFLDTLASTGMTWWVSSVVFCASILAGCWYRREFVISIPYFRLFCFTVTAFFVSVFAFGLLAAYATWRLWADVDHLLNAAGHSDQTSHADFGAVMLGYLIGTTSFVLVTLCWFGLWKTLAQQRRGKTATAPVSPIGPTSTSKPLDA